MQLAISRRIAHAFRSGVLARIRFSNNEWHPNVKHNINYKFIMCSLVLENLYFKLHSLNDLLAFCVVDKHTYKHMQYMMKNHNPLRIFKFIKYHGFPRKIYINGLTVEIDEEYRYKRQTTKQLHVIYKKLPSKMRTGCPFHIESVIMLFTNVRYMIDIITRNLVENAIHDKQIFKDYYMHGFNLKLPHYKRVQNESYAIGGKTRLCVFKNTNGRIPDKIIERLRKTPKQKIRKYNGSMYSCVIRRH